MRLAVNDMSFAAETIKGVRREENEDRYVCRTIAGDFVLLAVIDGCGGTRGGAEAAAIAAERTVSYLQRSGTMYGDVLAKAMAYANNVIYEERTGGGRYSRMACVMSAALIDTARRDAEIAHVGDSRVYYHTAGSTGKVTHDHSPVGKLVDAGDLSEEDGRTHPARHMIDRWMGEKILQGRGEGYIESHRIMLRPGDRLMLCTDGLTDVFSEHEVKDFVCTPDITGRLGGFLHGFGETGDRDDVTVIVMEYRKDSLGREDTVRPARPASIARGKPVRSVNDDRKDVLCSARTVILLAALFVTIVCILLLL